MKRVYLDAVALIERLHRQFLEVVKVEVDRLGIRDINNVQALILYNIGANELTVGELTQRGYYLGSNVSYNLKKLVETEYVAQARSPHDRRSVRIRLTPKGLELHGKLDEVFARQVAQLERAAINRDQLMAAEDALRRLEGFWTSALVGAEPGVVQPLTPLMVAAGGRGR